MRIFGKGTLAFLLSDFLLPSIISIHRMYPQIHSNTVQITKNLGFTADLLPSACYITFLLRSPE